mgnify:CR=1 FL=1
MMTYRSKLNSMPPLMTLKQVSDVVFDNDSNANCQTIRRFIERGHFPAPKIPAINRGGSAYFSKDEVSQWFQKELIDENKSSLEG